MTAASDRFAKTLGAARGSGRPDDEPQAAAVTEANRRRRVLAVIAAHGILAHNTAVSMPGSYTAGRIAALVDHGGRSDLPMTQTASEELLADLHALAAQGLLYSYQESWEVTPAGLVELWTAVA